MSLEIRLILVSIFRMQTFQNEFCPTQKMYATQFLHCNVIFFSISLSLLIYVFRKILSVKDMHLFLFQHLH